MSENIMRLPTRFGQGHTDAIAFFQDELLPRLRNHEIDLFVAETSTLEHEADLQVHPLSRHPLYLFARAGHPLADRPHAVLGEILRWPVAAMARIPPRMLEPTLSVIARARPSRRCRRVPGPGRGIPGPGRRRRAGPDRRGAGRLRQLLSR